MLCLAVRRLDCYWVNHNFYTYVVLQEGTDAVAFESRLREVVIKYVGPTIVAFMGVDH